MFEINPFDPVTLVILSLLNPVVIAVAFILGRKSDQWQKIPVAAFAAALAGFLAYWVASYLGLIKVKALGGEAGMVALQFIFGIVWALIGYRLMPEKKQQ